MNSKKEWVRQITIEIYYLIYIPIVITIKFILISK